MHTHHHFDPHVLTAGLAALVLALMLALVPSLPEIDFGSSGGSTASPNLAAPAATTGTTTKAKPRWVTDPLRAPAP